jgi:hypothetical protein
MLSAVSLYNGVVAPASSRPQQQCAAAAIKYVCGHNDMPAAAGVARISYAREDHPLAHFFLIVDGAGMVHAKCQLTHKCRMCMILFASSVCWQSVQAE